jgi:hypothetical protein
MRIPGRGDEHDLRATAVDLMADVCHYAAKEGITLDEIADKAQAPGGDVYARIFASVREVLEAKGHGYEDALWSVSNHLGVELGSGIPAAGR